MLQSDYSGLRLCFLDSVYEPAEDSFLLAKHAAKLKGRILEIGCGSGIATLHNAKVNPQNEVISVDINPDAVKCAKENAKRNNIKNIKFFKSDLFSAISPSEKFDAILFNPPYLPTTRDSRLKTRLNAAFDGGESGRKTLDRFLRVFDKFLKPDGIVLLVHSSLNNLEKTKRVLAEKNFRCEMLETGPFFFERIYLLKIKKLLYGNSKC
ncbi:MAG: methyltransferase [Candidatus Aenigmarchaeota archaeon]|nr:methyltransferase [Candidatus Aenigmarchaeota archaeon]